MRTRTILVLCLTLSLFISAFGQDHRLRTEWFSAEDIASFRTPIPKNVLRLLAHRKEVRESLAGSKNQHPEKLFHATKTHLYSANQTDLVVVGERPVSGADNNWFWVVRSVDTNPAVVLWVGCNSLTVRTTRRNEYRDISSDTATAGIMIHEAYRFDGRVHKLVKRTEKPNTN